MFRSSGALASAYGIAVTGTMVVTAILALIVVWKYWKWPLWAAAALMVPFLLIDLTFLGANLLKMFAGRLGAALDRRHDHGGDDHLAEGRAHSRRQDARGWRRRSTA